MNEYRYLLIRYVPDADRMEPLNVGVILQDQETGRLEFKLNPHAAKQKIVDTPTWHSWKAFFQEEIKGSAYPLFQPDRRSSEFLRYLEGLCNGPILLTRPLSISTGESDFGTVLESLFSRLVAPRPSEEPAATRPTGRFRQLAVARRFVQRGLRKHTHVVINENRLWIAYRQVLDGELLAIDKVEVANQIGHTANEIERLPKVIQRLPEFLRAKVDGKATRYVLLADQFASAFSDQTPSEFDLMREDLESAIKEFNTYDIEVIRTTTAAENLASEIDKKLEPSTAEVQ
ncbi:hypothetical protein RAS1_05570 [Phycisphaerae bacterium RAS1]|nr:hypothetical protein RAS1_05570 [Phycisphaerae bacterium RAS1]